MIRLPSPAAMFCTALLFMIPGLAALAAEEAWVQPWNGPSSINDEGMLGVFGDDGAVYTAGMTRNTETELAWEDFFINKLDADGNLLWSRVFGDDYYDTPAALVMTPDGNLAMLGTNDGQTRSLVTVVMDGDGNIVWEDHREVTGWSSPNIPPDLAVDADGNLTIVAVDNDLMLVRRLSATGALLFETYLPDLGIFMEVPTGLALDADGNTFVAGLVMGLGAGSANAHGLFKVDADGEYLWHHLDTGDIGGIFEYADVALGPDGQPVMVSNPESTCGLFEIRVTKVDALTGEVLWLDVLSDDPCHVFEPTDMAIDHEGNILVGSFGRKEGSTDQMQLTKWNADGQQLWYNEYVPEGTFGGQTAAVAVDATGAIYTTGFVAFDIQDRDFITLKYTADGSLEWDQRWDGGLQVNDWPHDLAVSPSGKVAVFGQGYFGAPRYTDAVTILYEPSGVAPVIPGSPAADQSVRALLNPFSASTRIRYSVGQSTDYKLSVFDIRGRRVATLSDGFAAEGSHEIGWSGRDDTGRALPSGVYLVALETRLGVTTQRVGLVR